MEVKYSDDARDHVEMLRAHERSRDAQGFARLKSIARRRGPFYGDYGGVVSDVDITRRSTAQILQDVGRLRPGDYLASDVKNDAVPEDVRATPVGRELCREPSWHAAGGTKRHQLNTIAGYETKYFEATYALEGEPYAMKCKATRAERDNGEVRGPVLITVYQGAPKDGRAKKRAKTTAASLPVAAAPAPQQLDDDDDEPLVAETPAPPPDDHDLLDDDELDEIADGEDPVTRSAGADASAAFGFASSVIAAPATRRRLQPLAALARTAAATGQLPRTDALRRSGLEDLLQRAAAGRAVGGDAALAKAILARRDLFAARRVLIVHFAGAARPLALDEEMQAVSAALNQRDEGDLSIRGAWVLREEGGITLRGLRGLLDAAVDEGVCYDAIAFSGHGEGGALAFASEGGNGQHLATADEVATLLGAHGPPFGVVLNACDTLEVAKNVVARGVPLCVGTEGAITDRAAVLYSAEFWAAVATGGDFRGAHETAYEALDRASLRQRYFQNVYSVVERMIEDDLSAATPLPPLRPYQARIVGECVAARGNSIVVLPTGAGKTRIAVEVVRRVGRPALVLVPTRLLVGQQAGKFREGGFAVGEFHGGVARFPRAAEVVVSTPESFKAQGVPASTYKCVVFDEVHHCHGSHPYHELARRLRRDPSPPRLLGLTATLTYEMGEDRRRANVQTLLADFGATLVTASTDELRAGGYHAAERTADVRIQPRAGAPAAFRDVSRAKEVFWERIDAGTASRFARSLAAHVSRMEAALPNYDSPLRQLNAAEWAQAAWGPPLTDFYEALRLVCVSFEDDEDAAALLLHARRAASGSAWPPADAAFVDALPRAWPRFDELKATLGEKVEKFGAAFRGVVFVQQRAMTEVVEYVIGDDPALRALSTRRVHAETTADADRATLAAFASGECNCLVATAKAEEGMDIAATNVVIRFDPILNPVSLAQSRGRARQESSDFVVLAQRPDRTVRDFEAVARRQADELASGATALTFTGQTSIPAPRGIDAASADAALAATQGTTQTNCRMQLKELCERFRVGLAFSDATPAPGGGFACDVSVGNTHVGRGVGPRKALAKENAAENALRALAREPSRDL